MKKNQKTKRNNKIKGFTLSEVLLVLSVIGVVAALTIPNLIQKVSNDQYASKLKKEYSVLSQAYNMIITDAGGSIMNDPTFNSATGDHQTDSNAMNKFAAKLNIIKNCGSDAGCWYDSALKYLGGTTSLTNNIETYWAAKYGKAVLADGTSIVININGNSCTLNAGAAGTPLTNSVCGVLNIDLNGSAGPNTMGRDYFEFYLTQTGIYPLGSFGDGKSCDTTSSTGATCTGCAGKVLTEGAMNY